MLMAEDTGLNIAQDNAVDVRGGLANAAVQQSKKPGLWAAPERRSMDRQSINKKVDEEMVGLPGVDEESEESGDGDEEVLGSFHGIPDLGGQPFSQDNPENGLAFNHFSKSSKQNSNFRDRQSSYKRDTRNDTRLSQGLRGTR